VVVLLLLLCFSMFLLPLVFCFYVCCPLSSFYFLFSYAFLSVSSCFSFAFSFLFLIHSFLSFNFRSPPFFSLLFFSTQFLLFLSSVSQKILSFFFLPLSAHFFIHPSPLFIGDQGREPPLPSPIMPNG